MAKPCTPHPIAQRVQLFKPSADNGGVKGPVKIYAQIYLQAPAE